MTKTYKKSKMMLFLFLISGIIVILCAAIMFGSVYFSVKLDKNTVISAKAQVQLLDKDDIEINNNSLYRYIKYEDISTNIISAFVALEDKRFFNHKGVDYYRTAGAFYNNLKNRYYKEGGSTITQQLAKNTQLSNEKTIKRKIKEMKLAKDIEKNYTKEEILEMYLNAIYFGYGLYGIDSACRNYFQKEPIDVSINEAAILAGIVKNPSNYSPVTNPTKANVRKNLVLRLMFEQNYIEEKEYNDAVNTDFHYTNQKDIELSSPYYANAIMEASILLNLSENDIIKGKYKIFTNYDKDSQQILYEAFQSKEFEAKDEHDNNSSYSSLLCDNKNAGIIAYFSNVDNNIFKFRRQPASIIKPILVYIPALESNYITTQSPYLDEKVNINGYSPNNYGNSYSGWTTIENAVKNSINTVAVQLLNEVGVPYSKDIAQKMGIKFDENDQNIALALGGMTYGTTTIELCNAYMTLANGGMYANNSFIRKITDEQGKTIYSNNRDKTRVISEDNAYLMTDMLISTAKDGTAKKLSSIPYDVASKTGTVSFGNTAKNTDCWNLSYTTQNTLCVWYGAQENNEQSAITTTGGGLPTLLASYIYKSLPTPQNKYFTAPEDIVELEIDLYAMGKDNKLLLSNQYTPEKYRKNGLFSIKNYPIECSKYFDIDNIYIDVERQENGYKISFDSQEEFDYCLVRENVYTYEKEYTDIYNDFVIDNTTLENNVYLYYLEVYCDNERLGFSKSKLIFT